MGKNIVAKKEQRGLLFQIAGQVNPRLLVKTPPSVSAKTCVPRSGYARKTDIPYVELAVSLCFSV